jgi:nucleoside-diphosphate-sugar epimerase
MYTIRINVYGKKNKMQINHRTSSLPKDPKRRRPDKDKLEKLVGWKPTAGFEERTQENSSMILIELR